MKKYFLRKFLFIPVSIAFMLSSFAAISYGNAASKLLSAGQLANAAENQARSGLVAAKKNSDWYVGRLNGQKSFLGDAMTAINGSQGKGVLGKIAGLPKSVYRFYRRIFQAQIDAVAVGDISTKNPYIKFRAAVRKGRLDAATNDANSASQGAMRRLGGGALGK